MRDLSAAARDCPLAPPDHASVYARTLHRACLIVGGIGKLAEQLKVPVPDLRGWMEGEAAPPEAVFMGAVEVLLLYTASRGLKN